MADVGGKSPIYGGMVSIPPQLLLVSKDCRTILSPISGISLRSRALTPLSNCCTKLNTLNTLSIVLFFLFLCYRDIFCLPNVSNKSQSSRPSKQAHKHPQIRTNSLIFLFSGFFFPNILESDGNYWVLHQFP